MTTLAFLELAVSTDTLATISAAENEIESSTEAPFETPFDEVPRKSPV
jgi:hypothetical protein